MGAGERSDREWLRGAPKGAAVVFVAGLAILGAVLLARSDAMGSGPAPVTRIDVNRASGAELRVLPGIGPALALRIIEDRERLGAFETVDDLERVRGIGPRTVKRIRGITSVGEPAP